MAISKKEAKKIANIFKSYTAMNWQGFLDDLFLVVKNLKRVAKVLEPKKRKALKKAA
jgi:hypothetical protein